MPDVWDRYLPGYHDANPGITEELLAQARDASGRSPYDWLLEAVPTGVSTVVDLACGSGPLGRRLRARAAPEAGSGARTVGVDRSAGELAHASGPRAQATATALPLVRGCAGAVVSSMALMLLHPLEAVLAEVARVLAAGGTLVATVPTRSSGTPIFAAILRELGQVGVAYPEPLDPPHAAQRFSTSGLNLEGDETEAFTRTVRDAGDAALVVRSFYAPGAGPGQVAAAEALLRRAAPLDVTYRIRRLVARR